jgi:hypothetical protein
MCLLRVVNHVERVSFALPHGQNKLLGLCCIPGNRLPCIEDLLRCGDGIALGASDPAFGLLAADGSRRLWKEHVQADMRGKVHEHFTVSTDAGRVRFGLREASEEPVLFDLVAQELVNAPEPVQDLRPADTRSLAVTDWINSIGPKVSGTPIKLEQYETAYSLAVAPDKLRFIIGNQVVPARLRQGWQSAMEDCGFRRCARRQHSAGWEARRCRLWRRHDTLASAERWQRAARPFRTCKGSALGRLDAQGLLHGVPRRTRPDRLAR